MDWNEINEAIREKVNDATDGLNGDEADQAKANVLDNLDQGVRQFLWNGGHKAATAQKSDRIKDLQNERDRIKSELEQTKEQLQALEEDQPNVEKIRSEYEEQIRNLKEEHQEAVEELRGKLHDRDKGSFKNRALAEGSDRLDRDWLDVQLERMEMEGRIQRTEDGSIQVLQPGKDIPYMADSEDELAQTVVEELAQEAPTKFKLSQADSGGGSRGEGSGPSSASKYDQAREAGQQSQESRQNQGPSLKERLNMPT